MRIVHKFLPAHPLADQAATEDRAFSFAVPAATFSGGTGNPGYTASRADGGPLPGWLRFDANTCGFSGTPGNPQAGSWSIKVTATDTHKASASGVFTLAVAASHSVAGSAGADHLIGTARADSLDGRAGNDTLDGLGGNDSLKGGAGCVCAGDRRGGHGAGLPNRG